MRLLGNGLNPGLVDLGNIVKAMIYFESTFDVNENEGLYKGLMQVRYGGEKTGKYEFETNPNMEFAHGLNFAKTGKEFFNPFNNIGVGIGYLFTKLILHSSYKYIGQKNHPAPTIDEWMDAVFYYNYGDKDPGYYRKRIWTLFKEGKVIGQGDDFYLWTKETVGWRWGVHYWKYSNWWGKPH